MKTNGKLHIAKIAGVAAFNVICLFSIIYCIVTTAEKREAMSKEADVTVIEEFEAPASETGPAENKEPSVAAPAISKVAASSAPEARLESKEIPGGFVIDDFEDDKITNKLGERANVYVMAPSRIMVAEREDTIDQKATKVLMIKYDKKNSGGPNGMGGWCGYYTTIKDSRTGEYLDGTDYKYLSFWVKGEKGDENFMIGLADEHWDKIGDSLKSEEVLVYLDTGKITTEWQKVKIPLDVFFLDYTTLSSMSINFEASCFPEGASQGIVYIDDIALEK